MLQPGIILGGIRIDSLLGRGAMGEVYLGQQVSLKRPVAVKRIAEHLLGNEEAIGRFAREAQCVARIQSPHVVAVHDFMRVKDDQGSEHALLVMELVDGGSSLRALLANRGQSLDWRTASALILHAAEGLAAAAEHGVVHRDIKPDNVMVTRKGVAKLADFGLAKSVDSSAMTLEGTVMGTPLYLPPEACRSQQMNARGDLYSLGCTWFHLLAGRPPFQAASTVALLRAHLDDAPPDLRSLAPSVPEAIAALVHRLLAKDPAQRLPSAQALVDELHALAAQGITLPRTVPEIFTVDAATTVTRLADAGKPDAGKPEASLYGGASPSSAAATLPMGSTAATVLAEPTDRVEAPSALTAKATAPGSPSPGAVPAAVTPAAPAVTRRGPMLLVVVGAVIVLAIIGVAVVIGGGPKARVDVEQALAAKDYGLALQRAATNLSAKPGDADAVALVREAVNAEVRALIAAGRVEDARKRIADHRAAFTWLDTGVLDGELAIASAVWLATHHQEKEAVEQFEKLRQGGANPVAIDRAMVESLADGNRPAAAIGAAWRLAEAGTGPLEPKVKQILTYALTWDGPFGDSIVELRRLLLKRDPTIVNTVRPWLEVEDYEKRYNTFFLLQDAGKLTDAQIVAFHVRAVMTLSSSYTAATESATWLAAEVAKPEWNKRKAAAKLPAIGEAPPMLRDWNEHAEKMIPLLAAGFMPEIEARALVWITDDYEQLRWNALRLLIAGNRAAKVDVAGFHAHTLATFDPLYESAPFTAALAFFAAKAGSADAPAAKKALTDGTKHIQKEIDAYEKANGNFMQLRANTCKERLQQVGAVLSKF
ncbi:MAG TPA: serine/threonine-protein kinase [Planctomycetota bacterium]|nr:serine/threonine-protein kinase [Planctomycetota bacterium]